MTDFIFEFDRKLLPQLTDAVAIKIQQTLGQILYIRLLEGRQVLVKSAATNNEYVLVSALFPAAGESFEKLCKAFRTDIEAELYIVAELNKAGYFLRLKE